MKMAALEAEWKFCDWDSPEKKKKQTKMKKKIAAKSDFESKIILVISHFLTQMTHKRLTKIMP